MRWLMFTKLMVIIISWCCCSVAQFCLTFCDPHGLQHARLPCLSPSPGLCSDSCPSSRWCHPTISPSVVPFSSWLQSFPASGSFPMSQLFPTGGQSIGASASASVHPTNIQGTAYWFDLHHKMYVSQISMLYTLSVHSTVCQLYLSITGRKKIRQYCSVKKKYWKLVYLDQVVCLGFPCGSVGKESTCNMGDLGSVPGFGRYPGERKGYPLQYSDLENSMDCIVHGVAKSQTQLSDFHFHTWTKARWICVPSPRF